MRARLGLVLAAGGGRPGCGLRRAPTRSGAPRSSRRARPCGSRSAPRSSPRRASSASCGGRRSRSTATPSTCARASARPRTSTRRSRRRHRRLRRLHRHRALDRGRRGGLRPRPRRDLRAGPGSTRARTWSMSEMTPFENKDAIATTDDASPRRTTSTTIADLGGLDDFVLGARPEFEDLYLGLAGLQQVYGLDQRDLRAVRAGRAVRRPRQRRRRRGRRLHHRPAARDRELHPARGPRAALRLAERRHGGQAGQARLDRRRRVPARRRHGQRRSSARTPWCR